MDFRRDHIGNTEQAVRALIYIKNQNRHLTSASNQPSHIMPGRNEMQMHNQIGASQTGMRYQPNPMHPQTIHNPVSATNSYFSPSSNTPMHNISQYQGSNPQVHQQLTPDVYGQPTVSDRDRLQMLMHDQRQIHPGYTNQMGRQCPPRTKKLIKTAKNGKK